MIPLLLDPLRLVLLVVVALGLGVRWGRRAEGARSYAFLLANGLLLSTWFGGRWQGVLLCLGLGGVLYGLIRASRERRGVWVGTLAFLIFLLALAKYDYPGWLPHQFRGGIWLRAFKQSIGIPDLKVTLGVSYLCFRLIHVLVDHGNGRLPRLRLLPFLNYILFAAPSVAGPINRYEDFERDFEKPVPLATRDFVGAMRRIVLGLTKKILIAGLVAPYALGSLEPGGRHPALLLLVGCVGYSVYLYADFSGYTDIAIGLGRLFGIVLPENFNRPYAAPSVQEFWNRWHMSLTQWIKTYVFYPLNLWLTRRYPKGGRLWNPLFSIMVAFLLIGIWHGDHWNYVVFGLVHGAGIGANMLLHRLRPPKTREHRGLALLWRQLATFAFVSLAWIFFIYPLGDLPWLFGQAWGGPR